MAIISRRRVLFLKFLDDRVVSVLEQRVREVTPS